MNSPKTFEILIRRRIPYLSSILFWILMLFSIFLFLLYVIMLPTRNTSAEMASLYYILLVPDWLKISAVFSLVGSFIIGPIYFKARLHKSAILTVHDNYLSIVGQEIDITILRRKIDKIICNDLHHFNRIPKGIVQFVINQKQHKVTTFRLIHYDQAEEVLDTLNGLGNIPLAFYEDDMLGDHHQE